MYSFLTTLRCLVLRPASFVSITIVIGGCVIGSCVIGGCGPAHEHAATDAAIGGAVGAGAGAAIGSASGNIANGAVIGGAAGAITGGIIGNSRDIAEANTKEQDEFIIRQHKAMEKQQDELDDLRRQKYQDEYYRERYQVKDNGQ